MHWLNKNYTIVLLLDTSHFYVYSHSLHGVSSEMRAQMTESNTLVQVDFEFPAVIVRTAYISINARLNLQLTVST